MNPPSVYTGKHSSIIPDCMEVLPINRDRLSYH